MRFSSLIILCISALGFSNASSVLLRRQQTTWSLPDIAEIFHVDETELHENKDQDHIIREVYLKEAELLNSMITRPPTRAPAQTLIPTPRTNAPTPRPTHKPSQDTSRTRRPTNAPSQVPVDAPTGRPTLRPSRQPTELSTRPTPFSPTPASTPSTTLEPTNIPCANLTREEAMFEVLSQISPVSQLLEPGTPQFQAYLWILVDDPLQVNPCTYPTVAQRFAMAVLYFSTIGGNWTASDGWLTGEQECLWLGATCDPDLGAMLLVRLVLRKFDHTG